MLFLRYLDYFIFRYVLWTDSIQSLSQIALLVRVLNKQTETLAIHLSARYKLREI